MDFFPRRHRPKSSGSDGVQEVCRCASHAGSWYSSSASILRRELDDWISATELTAQPNVRAVIAPHAGYRYSGRAAAYAFAQIDPSKFSRIFLLGPSHHHFTRNCVLPNATLYKSPLGDIPVDTIVVSELRASGAFEELGGMEVEEAEHSLEMHLPYLAHVFKGHNVTLVPIMVGALTPKGEEKYGKLLRKYLEDPSNFFSVSSDFCHWGQRFSYTRYDASHGSIHRSIEHLDREAMDAIEKKDPAAFTRYLEETENTICGRHPIGVLLQMLKGSTLNTTIKFVRYEQSSQCRTMRDSSVSYASAVVLED